MKHLDLATLWRAMIYIYNVEACGSDREMAHEIAEDAEMYIHDENICISRHEGEILYYMRAIDGKIVSVDEIPEFELIKGAKK